MTRILLLAVAVFLIGTSVGAGADAEPVAKELQSRFLRDRDVAGLLAAFEAPNARPPEAIRRLARLAAGKPIPEAPPTPGPEGLDGLPYVVQALRQGDLMDAGRRVTRCDRDGGLACAWAHALIRLRRGDDSGAIGRLLAPPFMDWYRDAFPLALLGAALRDDDRRMLAEGARRALARAASRRRTPAIVAMARALAALDPEAGRRAHAFAIDALRRGGEADAAVRLLAAAPSAGVAPTDPLLALQAALLAWERGDPARIRALLAGRPPPGTQSVYLALRRATRRARPVVTLPPLGHEPGARAFAVSAARLATALGTPVSAAAVERWGREQKRDLAHARTLRAFFEAQGLHVLACAGDSRPGDALLAAGMPFLLLRLARGGDGYADAPALVKGYDSATGLWLLDEPDVRRFDVVPHAAAAKARMLCVVPRDRRALLAPFEKTQAATAGRVIEAALDAAEHAQLEQAIAQLSSPGVPTSGVVDLYRGYLLYRDADGRDDDARAWERVLTTLGRSRRVAPMLAFEEFARGEAYAVQGKPTESLGAFDHVAYLEGESAELALTRFTIEIARGNRPGARTALDAALRLAPLDVHPLFLRATLYVGMADLDAARSDLRRALERRPDAVDLAVELARLELKAGKPQEALDLLDDIVRRKAATADDAILNAVRREAELALIDAASGVADLRPLVRSRDTMTRRRVAHEAAGRAGEPDAAEALLRTLLADPEAEVRVTALRRYVRPWLRGRIEKDAVLTRRITGLLEKDESAEVRRAAADLLGRVRSSLSCRALTAVIGGPARDADAGVRGAAARALVGHPVNACRRALVAALSDADLGVRKSAGTTLLELTGTTRGFEADDPPEKRAAAIAKWKAWLEDLK